MDVLHWIVDICPLKTSSKNRMSFNDLLPGSRERIDIQISAYRENQLFDVNSRLLPKESVKEHSLLQRRKRI